MSYFSRAPTTQITYRATETTGDIWDTTPRTEAFTSLSFPANFITTEIIHAQIVFKCRTLINNFAGANDTAGGKIQIYNITSTTWEDISTVVGFSFPMASLEKRYVEMALRCDLSGLAGVWSDYFHPGVFALFRFSGVEAAHDSINWEGYIEVTLFTR